MKINVKTTDKEFLRQFFMQMILASKRIENMPIQQRLPIVRRFGPIRIPAPPQPPIQKPTIK